MRLTAPFRLRDGEACAARLSSRRALSIASRPRSWSRSPATTRSPPSARWRTARSGSPHQIGVGLNRATPYLLAGSGVAICFRAGVINIGAEGQIALGGAGAAAVALAWPSGASALSALAALIGAAAFGAVWAGLATAIHLGRRVHEVLATLLLNFVALLMVQQALAGPLGQFGAGFLQSPQLPAESWLWKAPEFDAHVGFAHCARGAAALSVLLWRTPFGFALRVAGTRGGRRPMRVSRCTRSPGG